MRKKEKEKGNEKEKKKDEAEARASEAVLDSAASTVSSRPLSYNYP